MTTQMTKAELLDKLRAGRAEWEALLARVGEARMTEPGVEGEWFVKDVAAHIMVYERWVVGNLGGAVPAQPPLPPGVALNDLDERNAWFHELNRDRPLHDVLAGSRPGLRTAPGTGAGALGGASGRAVRHHAGRPAAPGQGARHVRALVVVEHHRRQRRSALFRPHPGAPRLAGRAASVTYNVTV